MAQSIMQTRNAAEFEIRENAWSALHRSRSASKKQRVFAEKVRPMPQKAFKEKASKWQAMAENHALQPSLRKLTDVAAKEIDHCKERFATKIPRLEPEEPEEPERHRYRCEW